MIRVKTTEGMFNIHGDGISIEQGTLCIRRGGRTGDLLACFAPGVWLYMHGPGDLLRVTEQRIAQDRRVEQSNQSTQSRQDFDV